MPNLHLAAGTDVHGRFNTTQGGTGAGGFVRQVAPDGTVSWVQQNGTAAPEPAPASSGGDGPMRVTLPDLRWNVAILNGLALLFTGALVGMFLWMVDRIDDKFDAVNAPLMEVREAVSAQGATLQAIDKKLDQISQAQKAPSDPDAKSTPSDRTK